MKRGLSLLIAAVIFIFPFSLSAAADQPVIRSGNPDSMKIALTFDDGPHPYKTDAVLDILARYGIRATFFVIGENVSYYPQPLKRAVALGHEIGNHTYHHARISEGCDAVTAEEIEKTEEIIFRTAGYRTRLFRPPEGAYDDCALEVVKNKNYRVILWTVDSRDWENKSAEAMVQTVMSNVRGGSILLFHDYMGKRSNTLEAIDVLIPRLIARGYRFVTVSELLEQS
ncbi:MAG: polysaccharide deacetylase family protein [Clostridia bacterium]|nr:polysaccharide deacetylase family protein [Clostridia bacterium]